MEYIGGVQTDNFTRRFMNGHLRHWRVFGFGYWVFHDAADNAFVGDCGFARVPQLGKGAISLSYALMPRYWGMGLATEMARAVLRIGLTQCNLGNVIAFIHPRNIGSRRVAVRVGFHCERYDLGLKAAGIVSARTARVAQAISAVLMNHGQTARS